MQGGKLLQCLAHPSPGDGGWRPVGAAVCKPHSFSVHGCWGAGPLLHQYTGHKAGLLVGTFPLAQPSWSCEKLRGSWRVRE